MKKSLVHRLLLGATILPSSAALAQNVSVLPPAETESAQAGAAEAAHPDRDQAIVVTGVRRSAHDVLGSVTVVDAEDLARDMKSSIGDTLAKLPGVTASSFGPTASRPILRDSRASVCAS